MTMVRTFIAIRISEAARSTLADVQRTLRTGSTTVRWEHPTKMHLTMKFLGDTPSEAIPAIVGQLEAIGKRYSPMEMTVSGIGGFPDRRRPRVIWAGCSNADGNLARLKGDLESSFGAMGFEADRNAFHPHITLGRCRDGLAEKELISLLETVTFDPVSFIIQEIVLMKSTLKPGGSEYSVLQSIHLAG